MLALQLNDNFKGDVSKFTRFSFLCALDESKNFVQIASRGPQTNAPSPNYYRAQFSFNNLKRLTMCFVKYEIKVLTNELTTCGLLMAMKRQERKTSTTCSTFIMSIRCMAAANRPDLMAPSLVNDPETKPFYSWFPINRCILICSLLLISRFCTLHQTGNKGTSMSLNISKDLVTHMT